MVKEYLYSGAGNLFVIIDGRNGKGGDYRRPERVREVCTAHGTDGLMILSEASSSEHDFRMDFFNPDGSTGMMCGNGGRCIVAFAASLSIMPKGMEYNFEAPDGNHTAMLFPDGSTVRLKMRDAAKPGRITAEGVEGWFANTGTRHFVVFRDNVAGIDVEAEGSRLRHSEAFAPEGANVNFVSFNEDGSLNVRTFEKGVEHETGACGTGITAAALAAYCSKCAPEEGAHKHFDIHAYSGDMLSVDFVASASFTEIFLTGPTKEL